MAMKMMMDEDEVKNDDTGVYVCIKLSGWWWLVVVNKNEEKEENTQLFS